MEVSGTSSSFLFTSPFAVSGGNKATVNEARNDLRSGGQSRQGIKDLASESLDIARRGGAVFEGSGPLAGVHLSSAVNVITKKSERSKLPIAASIKRNSRLSALKVERLGRLRASPFA